MTIEQIVRPFAAPQPLGTRRVVPSSTKGPPQTAGVTWGAVGTLPTPRETDVDQPALMPGFNTRKKVLIDTNREDKDKRVTDKVRVENPDDKSQYVIVERIRQIAFKKDNPPTLRSLGQPGGTTAFPRSGPGTGDPQTPHSTDTPVEISSSQFFIDAIEKAGP